MDILKTKDLKKYYKTSNSGVVIKALDGIDLSVEKGEFLSVTGTSGSGKSTLLNMLGGLDTPTSGSIYIDGNDISQMDKDELAIFRRRKTGFVFQNYNLLPLMNVYENIILPVRLDGIKPDKAFVDKIITMLGLGKKKYAMPNQLSSAPFQKSSPHSPFPDKSYLVLVLGILKGILVDLPRYAVLHLKLTHPSYPLIQTPRTQNYFRPQVQITDNNLLSAPVFLYP